MVDDDFALQWFVLRDIARWKIVLKYRPLVEKNILTKHEAVEMALFDYFEIKLKLLKKLVWNDSSS